MAQRISKTEARYQPYPKATKRCEGCTMFRVPKSCTLVQGEIARCGWCRYHEAKK